MAINEEIILIGRSLLQAIDSNNMDELNTIISKQFSKHGPAFFELLLDEIYAPFRALETKKESTLDSIISHCQIDNKDFNSFLEIIMDQFLSSYHNNKEIDPEQIQSIFSQLLYRSHPKVLKAMLDGINYSTVLNQNEKQALRDVLKTVLQQSFLHDVYNQLVLAINLSQADKIIVILDLLKEMPPQFQRKHLMELPYENPNQKLLSLCPKHPLAVDYLESMANLSWNRQENYRIVFKAAELCQDTSEFESILAKVEFSKNDRFVQLFQHAKSAGVSNKLEFSRALISLSYSNPSHSYHDLLRSIQTKEDISDVDRQIIQAISSAEKDRLANKPSFFERCWGMLFGKIESNPTISLCESLSLPPTPSVVEIPQATQVIEKDAPEAVNSHNNKVPLYIAEQAEQIVYAKVVKIGDQPSDQTHKSGEHQAERPISAPVVATKLTLYHTSQSKPDPLEQPGHDESDHHRPSTS